MLKRNVWYAVGLILATISCKKEETQDNKSSVPDPIIQSISSVTTNSAAIVCNIDSEGSSSITERGVCYGLSTYPDTSATLHKVGTGTGLYSANLSALNGKTTYYVRAYAINGQGVFYSSQKSFTTF